MAKKNKKQNKKNAGAVSEITRAPIVTVMGHVDHGKTSILDAIRETEVQQGEHGGITQSIGAYQVQHKGKEITFIDTPGHAAFSKMRSRGSNLADVVILVVAADDGVQPQTVEALNHARSSEAEIVIALNKMDLPTANPNLVKKQLADQKIEIEEYGGAVKVFETSAESGTGLTELLDGIIEISEKLDLKATANGPASGVIIESQLDPKRGVVASGIVLSGELTQRAFVVADTAIARIKVMHDWRGESFQSAGPAVPVEILGFDKTPDVGASFASYEKQKEAQGKVKENQALQENETLSMLDRVQQAFLSGTYKEIPLIIKADTQGSLEAVVESISGLDEDEVKLNVIHQGVGEVSENDVFLAMPVSAIILAFNTSVSNAADSLARKEKIIYRTYNIIYHLVEELQDVIAGEIGLLARRVDGEAKLKQLFELTNGSVVAGSEVITGKITRNNKIDVMRDGEIIYEGLKINSLKKGKEDAGSVAEGEECGILLNLSEEHELQEGDVLQAVE